MYLAMGLDCRAHLASSDWGVLGRRHEENRNFMIVNYDAQKEEAALCFSAFSGFQVTAKLTAPCTEMGV